MDGRHPRGKKSTDKNHTMRRRGVAHHGRTRRATVGVGEVVDVVRFAFDA